MQLITVANNDEGDVFNLTPGECWNVNIPQALDQLREATICGKDERFTVCVLNTDIKSDLTRQEAIAFLEQQKD